MRIIFGMLIGMLIISFSVIGQKYKINNSKIIYESISNKNCSTLEEATETMTNQEGITLHVKFDYNQFEFTEKLPLTATLEETRAYKRRLKEAGYSHHYDQNKKLVESMGDIECEELYVSKYSSFVDIEMTNEQFKACSNDVLSKISDNRFVDVIYVKEKVDKSKKDSLTNIINNAGGLEYYQNRTYTGEGINVGLLEIGVIDKDHQNLTNTSRKVRARLDNDLTDHATAMASIIAGSCGFAPDARILSVQLNGTPADELDWLIDNDVDIINMSYGEGNPDGYYNSDSAYIDYMAYTYRLIIIGAVGNDDLLASNPGIGYNVFSVGAINSENDLQYYSSYMSNTGGNSPDVVALDEYTSLPYISTVMRGTSVSCAAVTGMVTMFLDAHPGYTVYPEMVYSSIAANADDMNEDFYPADLQNGYSDKVGAGRFNLKRMIVEPSLNEVENTSNQENSIVRSIVVYLYEGQVFRASAYWMAKADGTVANTKMTNYDIRIYQMNNLLIGRSYGNSGNSELKRFVVPHTGNYRVTVYQVDKVTNNDHIGLSFRSISSSTN